MNSAGTIFGLRRHANVLLYPSQDELAAFLARPVIAGGRRTTREATVYRGLIEQVRTAERRTPASSEERVLCDVLRHTRFANIALAAEVACYQYLLESLRSVDIQKPAAFIRAAEEEIAKLDTGKKGQAERIARLRTLSNERKRQMEELTIRRDQLSSELRGIAEYVHENLTKIGQVCTTALAILSDPSLATQIERRMVEDLKMHFRSFLKSQTDRRSLTPAYLEQLRFEVARLGEELVGFRRDAAAAEARLYGSLLRHAEGVARELDSTMKLLDELQGGGDGTDQVLLSRIEQNLIMLLEGWQAENDLPEPRTVTPHTEVFQERRSEVLDDLFTLVSGERRATVNRRSGLDRRIFKLGLTTSVERRTAVERRSGRDRREALAPAF